jgi:hypothetical protein
MNSLKLFPALAMNRNLLFYCAGRVSVFDSTFPSIIEANGKSKLKKMSRTV